MLNGLYIKLIKGTEKRVFFMFDDGDVRELVSTGWSNIIDCHDFMKIYHKLIESGYKEIA